MFLNLKLLSSLVELLTVLHKARSAGIGTRQKREKYKNLPGSSCPQHHTQNPEGCKGAGGVGVQEAIRKPEIQSLAVFKTWGLLLVAAVAQQFYQGP